MPDNYIIFPYQAFVVGPLVVNTMRCQYSFISGPLGPVVQSPISANPGLNFNLLFLFMYFCMIIRFKTLENKTSIEPEKISGKTYSAWLMICWKI